MNNDLKLQLQEKKLLLEQLRKRNRDRYEAEKAAAASLATEKSSSSQPKSSILFSIFDECVKTYNLAANSNLTIAQSQLKRQPEPKKLSLTDLSVSLNLESSVNISPSETIQYCKETQTRAVTESEEPVEDNDHESTCFTPRQLRRDLAEPFNQFSYDDDDNLFLCDDTLNWDEEYSFKSPRHATENSKRSKNFEFSDEEEAAGSDRGHFLHEQIDYADLSEFLNTQLGPIESLIEQNRNDDIFFDYQNTSPARKMMQQSVLSLKKVFTSPPNESSSFKQNSPPPPPPTITSIDWSIHFPELIVSAYDNNVSPSNYEESLFENESYVCLINIKSNQDNVIRKFFSPSLVTCCIFSDYNPNLFICGTYSGQIVIYDVRSNKNTPVQRTNFSLNNHYNPVYCLKNCANEKSNLISMSNDGKICFWLIENMNKPVDMQELISSESSSSASISPMCIDLKEISSDSVSKGPKTKLAVIGAEDGSCSSFVVKKNKFNNEKSFYDHDGPVTKVCFSNAVDQMQESLFLSTSFDGTIKLWNAQDNSASVCTFEPNGGGTVNDVEWCPINPSIFASINTNGFLEIWDLSKNIEQALISFEITNQAKKKNKNLSHIIGWEKQPPALNKLKWAKSGLELAVGDDHGQVTIVELNEEFLSSTKTRDVDFLHNMKLVNKFRNDNFRCFNNK